jgi:2-dehydro-3-deoxygluconokinase
MNYGLAIRESATLDFLALGALVHRLDPGIIPFRKAHECQIHVSGGSEIILGLVRKTGSRSGEFNVAAKLSDCFGLHTGIVSAMVKYPIGDLVAERVRATGVTGPNIASVYSDRAYAVRGPVVYIRAKMFLLSRN